MDWLSYLSGFATATLIALVILESSNRELAIKARMTERKNEPPEMTPEEFRALIESLPTTASLPDTDWE